MEAFLGVDSGTKHAPIRVLHVRYRPAKLNATCQTGRTSATGPFRRGMADHPKAKGRDPRVSGGRLDPITQQDEQARRRSHAGLRLPSRLTARYGQAREALPPAWSDTFAIHPGGGSAGKYDMGVKGGDEIGGDGAADFLSPPGKGECEFQRLGFSQVLEIPREGVGLETGKAPSPEKSMTWRFAPRP